MTQPNSLQTTRRAISQLLDHKRPADARAAYYAFDHADERTTIVPWPVEGGRAKGYICFSRTGLDLFRPLVTMRLPWGDMSASSEVVYNALPPGASVMMSVPSLYMPLIDALFDSQQQSEMAFYALDRGHHEPILNVLVSRSNSANGLPRYVIRKDGVSAASASVNWQSRNFAEIGVETNPQFRRQGYGRSVVAALNEHLLQQGRTPLYAVSAENTASRQLAESVGFIDTGYREMFLEGELRPKP